METLDDSFQKEKVGQGPRRNGGMDLINANQSHRSINVSIAQYIMSSNKPRIIVIKEHE